LNADNARAALAVRGKQLSGEMAALEKPARKKAACEKSVL